MGPYSTMTAVLIEWRSLERHARGERLIHIQAGICVMSVSQGTPDTANKPLEARREAGNRFTHTTLVMPGLKTSSLRKASGYISVV